MSSDFVPNSFQTPNAYVDQFMDVLTPPEFKVLIYFVRRIFGFQKRQDRVALRQLWAGLSTRNGRLLDRGTGLSEDACRDAVRSLLSFGLLIAYDRNQLGTLYSLQLDFSKVNRVPLEIRRAAFRQSYHERFLGPVVSSEEPTLFDLDEVVPSEVAGSYPPCDPPLQVVEVAGSHPQNPLPATHNTQGNPDSKRNPVNMVSPGETGAAPARVRRTDAQRKGDLFDGVLASSAQRQPGQLDLAEFSEDVRPVFQAMFDLWGVLPPACSARSSMGALWQREARQVLTACAEFGLELLRDVKSADTSFVPARPGSLVGWCVPAAARRRKRPGEEPPPTNEVMGVRVSPRLHAVKPPS